MDLANNVQITYRLLITKSIVRSHPAHIDRSLCRMQLVRIAQLIRSEVVQEISVSLWNVELNKSFYQMDSVKIAHLISQSLAVSFNAKDVNAFLDNS